MSSADVSHDAFLQKKTFGALDGLRALSILAVVWHHTYEVPTGWKATDRGFLGVDLFFVISGFLIVSLLLRERDRRTTISLRDFYIRRFLRIFPLYYGVLLGLTAIFLTVGRHANIRDAFFADLPWALTYTSNWAALTTFLAITWSLSAEEQFYIVWPPLERYARGAALWVLGALLVVSQLVHFGFADGLLSSMGFVAPEPMMLRQTGFTPIILGVFLAHALHNKGSFERLAPVLGWRFMPVVAVVAIVGVCSIPIDDITGWPRLTLHLLMTLLLGSAVIREDHALMPLLRLKPLIHVGVLSYGVYLLHMLCRHAAKAALSAAGVTSLWPLFPLTLAITLAVAWLTYTFYEKRFLALKSRFAA